MQLEFPWNLADKEGIPSPLCSVAESSQGAVEQNLSRVMIVAKSLSRANIPWIGGEGDTHGYENFGGMLENKRCHPQNQEWDAVLVWIE